MKKIAAIILSVVFIFCLVACGSTQTAADPTGTGSSGKTGKTDKTGESGTSSGNSKSKVADPAQANEFTSTLRWDDEFFECRLPENREGNIFTDCGLSCMVTCDRYGTDVVAYHEYDDQGETVKKTVGEYTYDFQSFDNYGIKDWHIFVIRIAFTESHNQMEHEYYKIVYTVYGEGYPESQVEKFMQTIVFG
ncbi:MAG: hypothetical protein ILO42_08150 [Clostridia bacterium]|nr:hypothetical protein [Clostridia bacterium]